MLRDSQNRVRSMALVHEQLYRSEDLAQIDLGQYVEVLVRGLFKAQQSDLRRIRLRLETEPVRLAVDRAIPCGLIVNELVSNAFKHAFPDGREGELVVSLRPAAGGGCVLRVKDTGVGFPEGLDCRSSPSLGLKLVDLLVRQVRGRIERRREQGTEFLLELEPA
jgi:two-component sensor histidine kinase